MTIEQSGDAVAQSFLEICQELGCQPLSPLLECLQDNNPVVKVSGIQDSEQLYAVSTILPFANVQELDLSGLQLSGDQWCALLEACSRCSNLRVLSIKGCALGALGNSAEEQVARQLGRCCMTVLDASQNQLGDCFLSALSRSTLLREADVLTVLDLSENAIGDSGAAALAATLAAAGLQCPMKQLDLSFNRLGDSGARALANMMTAVPLLALELEGNQFSDAGGLALGDALKHTLCLQRLNLNHNHLSSSTFTSIADAISVQAGNLQELAVAGSSGSEHGIAALLTAACRSKALHLLDVRGLPLAGKAVAALCQLLRSGCPLVTLRLDVASREAAETIAQALPDKPTLMHLMMGGNVPEHVLSFIAAALSANTMNKVQAASRSSSLTPPRQRQRSGTPTQLQAHHHQLMQTPPVTVGGPGNYGRPFSGSSPRVPKALSPNSSSSDLGNTTPQRGLLFSSPSSSRGGTQHRSPSSSGRANVRTLSMQARRASVIDNQGLAGLAGGGAANKAAEVFKRHDMDNSGCLDAEEMMSALQELGMLEGMRPKQLGKFLSDAIREADTDRDGRVSIDEFTTYYERLARHYAEASRQGRIVARRRAPEVPLDAPSDDSLKRTFRTYCRLPIGQGRQVGGSVQQINAAQFNQLCRDAGILEPTGPLSQCAIDIVFTRSKPPGSRRLPFKHFLNALAAVADEAGVSFNTISKALSNIYAFSMQQQTEAGTGAAAEAAAAANLSRRHSVGNCCAHTRLSISDLTDTRVGPNVSNRSSSVTPRQQAAPLLAMSADKALAQNRPASATARLCSGGSTPWSARGSAGPPSANGAWGARTASPSWTPRSGSMTPGDLSAAEDTGLPKAERLLQHGRQLRKAEQERLHQTLQEQLQEQVQQQQLGQQHLLQQQQREQQQQSRQQQQERSSSGCRAAAEQQQEQQQKLQQRQPGGLQLLADRDAVQNPLFEGESDGSSNGAPVQTSICHRLLALEKKILQRVSIGSTAGPVAAATAAPAVGVEKRVAQLESGMDESRQQLSVLLSQQDELKGLLSRLLEGLEAAGLSTPLEASNSIKTLNQTVEGLSAEVARLRGHHAVQGDAAVIGGLQEQINQLTHSMDKRHSRLETAIYQVAHQVDLLDSRVKQEQQSTQHTLQSLMAGSSSAAAGAQGLAAADSNSSD